MHLICFATKGSGSNDEDRIRTLLEPLDPRVVPFDRARKLRSFVRLLRTLLTLRPELVVMEGTGVAGGAAILIARFLRGTPFVVSSGDAVAPYLGASHPAIEPIARIYERLLYRCGSGFIGWTPYLVGRALTWGAPRAMTAAGWAPYQGANDARTEVREALGIPTDALVFGLIGALIWNHRVRYCYGYELVQAITRAQRTDLYVVVAGDGSGKPYLERAAGALLGDRVILPGEIPQDQVPGYLAAMDVVSLPQSVDGVGSFRFTTKVSEYLNARRPIITGQIPFAYEFDDRWIWRLAGESPWDERYIKQLTRLMESLTPREIQERTAAIPSSFSVFDMERQQRQAVAFVRDVVGRSQGQAFA